MAEGREPFHRFSEKAKGIDLQAVDDTTVLGESDLQDVMREVSSLAERWQELGMSLGINKSDLKAIRFDSPIDCLTKTLTLWLRQRYEINKFGRPTWRRLVDAVEDHEGGNNRVLAETIAQNHPGLSELLRVQGRLEPPPQESGTSERLRRELESRVLELESCVLELSRSRVLELSRSLEESLSERRLRRSRSRLSLRVLELSRVLLESRVSLSERRSRELRERLGESELSLLGESLSELERREREERSLSELRLSRLGHHPVRHGQTSTAKISDSIHGVEVIGETDLVISTKEFSFEWVGYGLRLGVSKDSLPTGMEECRINIKASLYGLFELPEDSELLSPVFWISALCKFKKPITLELQHCGSRDEACFADLTFISTKCSQKTLPYTFKQLDGGRFSTDSSYGSIQLSHFSGVGVNGKKRTPRAYCAQIYYTIKEEADWRVYFIIIQDLDAIKTIARKHYGQFARQEATLRVKFERSKISLDIPEDGQVTKDGWKITPRTYPTIYRKDVDSFEPGQWIPECELLVVWDPECKDKKPVRLSHRVNLIGARQPYNFFNLDLNPAWKVNTLQEGRAVKELGTEDLDDITSYLHALDKTAVCNLGLVLGLGYTRLQGMMDSPTFLQDMLAAWLQKVDKVQQVGVPTWKKLVEALRDPRVGQNGISTNIEQDKLKPQ